MLAVVEHSQTSVKSQKVFKLWDYIMFVTLTLVTYAVIAYVLTFWFATDDWLMHPLVFWGLTAVFLSKLLVNQLRWWVLPFMRKPLQMPVRPGWRVGVATSFVPNAEPLEMLEETVTALVAMDYPHDTWVLDEDGNAEVKSLCERLGAFYFSRKNLSAYQTDDGTFQARTKHGNYNSWFHEIGFERYEIIATFDPDHVPQPEFLSETLGYFNDPKVGYVQAAQVYYNQKASFIARGAAEETYSYYSSTQMFCYSMGYPIITGCHNTHRVTALKQVGGFAAHDADDLLITLFYRAAGWQGVYVPKILAKGLTPVDWNGYLKQQLRWARAMLDIKFRIYPKMVGKLPYKEIVTSFFHGFFYLQGATTLIVLLLIGYMLATGHMPRAVTAVSLNFFLLPAVFIACDLYRQRFYLDWRNEWGVPWRAYLLQLAKSPYIVLAFYQVVLNQRFQYVLTNKVKEGAKTYKPFLPHLFAAALVCAAWVFGIAFGRSLHPVLHLVAAITVFGTLILASTGHMTFPEPYNPRFSPKKNKNNMRTQN